MGSVSQQTGYKQSKANLFLSTVNQLISDRKYRESNSKKMTLPPKGQPTVFQIELHNKEQFNKEDYKLLKIKLLKKQML